MRAYESAKELEVEAGQTVGSSEWLTIDQARIDAFAATTGDDQWIHTDPERASREAPGGVTIAHGYLTLSLLGTLLPQIMSVRASRIVNAGANKLRFLSPVPVGSRVRLTLAIASVEPASGGIRVTAAATMEIEGGERPALVAEIVFLYFD